jgi:plasmid maintenance system killer protein
MIIRMEIVINKILNHQKIGKILMIRNKNHTIHSQEKKKGYLSGRINIQYNISMEIPMLDS